MEQTFGGSQSIWSRSIVANITLIYKNDFVIFKP